MATDKKITDLTYAPGIDGNDIGIMARDGTDYQFPFSTFLQYVGSNLSVGASISFGNILPQNNQGSNGDLFINTTDNSFAQKVNGAWVIRYQSSVGNNNSIYYNLGLPSNSLGINGDTYVNTGNGTFYQKTNGSWAQVFSMQTGPIGPPGIKGDTGQQGLSGNGILHGTANPSNQNIGTDGDFYLNINTWTLFGPKTNGAWGIGIPLLLGGKTVIMPTDPRLDLSLPGTIKLTWDIDLKSQFGTDEANFKYLFASAANQPYKWNSSIQPIYYYDANGLVSFIEFEGAFDTYYKIIIT